MLCTFDAVWHLTTKINCHVSVKNKPYSPIPYVILYTHIYYFMYSYVWTCKCISKNHISASMNYTGRGIWYIFFFFKKKADVCSYPKYYPLRNDVTEWGPIKMFLTLWMNNQIIQHIVDVAKCFSLTAKTNFSLII